MDKQGLESMNGLLDKAAIQDKIEDFNFDVSFRFKDSFRYDPFLVPFAFDVLSSAKSLSQGMNILLERVGKNLSLGRIQVLWANQETGVPEILYLWQNQLISSRKLTNMACRYTSLHALEASLGESGIVCAANAKTAGLDHELRNLIAGCGCQAFVICGIYEESDRVCGSILFEVFDRERQWTKGEQDTFAWITKIITYFILANKNHKLTIEKIEQLSNYDKVTGLSLYPNFKIEVSRLLRNGSPGKLAVVNSDISNFKYINDTYGLEVGDRILKAFADKLIINNKNCLAGCRVYADNFICLVRIKSKETLANAIIRYNTEFETEQKILYPSSNFTIHTGAYVVENPDMDMVQILDGASMAKNMVKDRGELKYAFFDDAMKQMVIKEGRILAEIKAAIFEKRLVPFLQPKFALDTREVIGAEALVRWHLEGKDYYYPGDFIPVLEKSGNIIEVDFCIYEQILACISRWMKEGRKLVPVSVNISRVHCRYQEFDQILIRMADQYLVPHNLIEIEITESAFLEDGDILMEKMAVLKAAGFILSIDDFGSGYSSLSAISRMPVDIIKMDQSFLQVGLDSERSGFVIEAMIHMAHKMDLEIICEGVETQEQVEFLLRCGCMMGQGYLFARPMPVDEFVGKYLGQ